MCQDITLLANHSSNIWKDSGIEEGHKRCGLTRSEIILGYTVDNRVVHSTSSMIPEDGEGSIWPMPLCQVM